MAEAWEIVTVVEPEWDDHQRDKMLGLSLYRKGICNDCGYPEALHDPRYNFAIEVGVCPVKAALDKLHRIQADADEKARKAFNRPPAAPDPADGRQVRVGLKPPTRRGA